ncbi:MAG: carboxypeptidase regulatory-like domain-containing protein [Planctomycetes bacterium]|nr:carboxypeptidase regulatory-like domain-containing protein [Planctomycetota bacterium]
MNLSSLRYVALTFALPATAPAQQVTLTPLPHPASYPTPHGTETWLCYRIVDDLTGQPLTTAELHLVAEHPTPLPGRFWATRSATSDANGLVRIRTDDISKEWAWIIVRAKDHAPVASMSGFPDAVIRLPRGIDIPVAVRDWADRPVAGAILGFCRGCGHTPDLVNAATGPDGIALVRGIDTHDGIADIYVQHADCDLGYDGITWRPGEPPVVVRCGPSETITGTIVDTAGNPLAGIPITTNEVHRGPWAISRADGTFTLLGAGRHDSLHAKLPDRDLWFDRPGSFPARLIVPDANGERGQNGEVEPAAKEPEVPAGVEVEVVIDRKDAREPLEAHVALPLPVPPEAFGAPGKPADRVTMTLPATGPFAISLVSWPHEHQEVRKTFVFAHADAVPRPLHLAWHDSTRILGTLRDDRGKPVRANLRIEQWPPLHRDERQPEPPFTLCEDGNLDLPTELRGLWLLRVVPEQEDLLPRLLWLYLPDRADKVRVDLGAIVLRRQGTLRVLDVDGRPLRDTPVGFTRANHLDPGATVPFPLDDQGQWLGPDLRAGDAIVIAGEDDDPPFRAVLAGDGPWEVRLPAAEVRVLVQDERGEPLDVEGVLDDLDIEIDGERLLRNLAPGPHSLIVGAEGRQTAIVAFEVPATGRAEVTIRLPAR